MQKKWYAVHVLTSREDRVKRTLERRIEAAHMEDKIGRIVVPKERERRYRSGSGTRYVEHRLFPGYILIEMVLDDETWHFIRSTPGVTGFVGSQERPVPLRDHEVETILKMTGEETPKRPSIWHKGEMVRVRSGPFAEATGRIEEVNPQKQTLVVMLSVFGRETPVELDFSQVEKIQD